jgi:hypothetical protein
MGQTNARRVGLNVDTFINYARDDNARAALQDLFEEDTGAGYSEIAYTSGVFVSQFETYTDNTKTEIRTRTTFGYSPIPFVETVTKEYFKDGSVIAYRTLTATISYNANKTVNNIDIQVV